MVNSRIRTFQWIIIFVFLLFVLLQFTDSKKHRSVHSHHHRHQHHRKPHKKLHHHHHHHHNKHPSPSKNFSASTNDSSHEIINMTKFIGTRNSFLNETTNKIKSSEFTSTWNTTIGVNDTSVPSQNFNISNVSFIIEKFKDPSTLQSSILSRSSTTESIANIREIASNFLSTKNQIPNIHSTNNISSDNPNPTVNTTYEIIQESTNPGITESLNFSTEAIERFITNTKTRSSTTISRLQNPNNDEIVVDQLTSNTRVNTTYKRQKPPEELEKLFGTTKVTKENNDTPYVTMIRKKRSSVTNNDDEEEPKIRSLLDFNGPALTNESEDSEDSNSSYITHKRVKRDHMSEFDDETVVLDSNYLQDLEDSFAPSALEIQAESSFHQIAETSRNQRSNNPDNYAKQLRIKREAKDENNYVDNGAKDLSLDIEKKHVSATSEKLVDKDMTSESSFWENSTIKDESTSRNEFHNVENSRNISADVNLSLARSLKNEEDRNNREDNDSSLFQRKANSLNYYPQDDGNTTRNRLDDVYPDINDDPQNPSSMIQLVRTKRFGDGSVNPETLEISSPNVDQPDSRKIEAFEPWAEDNRIIDSMLTKVNYENAEDRESREARKSYNDNTYEKLDNDESPEMVLRDKRDSEFSGSAREKLDSERFRQQRKNHREKRKRRKKKKKKKKKHRKKQKNLDIKRDTLDGDVTLKMKRDTASDDDDDAVEGEDHIYESNVIKRDNARHRGDYEDENNLHFDANLPTRQARKELEDSQNIAKIPVENYDKQDISRCAEKHEIIIDDSRNREKRENTAKELKYYEKVREINDLPNGTSQIMEKNLFAPKMAESIGDIEELVQELVVKVNKLHGYVNNDDTGNNGELTKESRDFVTIGNDRNFAGSTEPSRNVQRKNALEKSKSKPVNDMKRREACWKFSQSKHDSKPSRNRRPAKAFEACEKKLREKRKSQRKWDRWTDWSSCSVTCGRGRQIRWRHCVRNCSTAETEMEEKACQLPACAPGKFLGIFG